MGLGLIELDVTFYADLLKGKCIGFGGKLGSGKTFLADALIEYINMNSSVTTIRRSFGDELRNFVENNVGIPVKSYKHVFNKVTKIDVSNAIKSILDHAKKENLYIDEGILIQRFENCHVYNDIYRAALQLIGTELYRNQVDPDIWANAVGNSLDKEKITIIDDCRFPNELKVVNNNGVSVYSMLLNYVDIESNSDVKNHLSEVSIGVSNFDTIFYSLIGQYSSKKEWGKVIFNHVASFYYLFNAIRDDHNKESLFLATIKKA